MLDVVPASNPVSRSALKLCWAKAVGHVLDAIGGWILTCLSAMKRVTSRQAGALAPFEGSISGSPSGADASAYNISLRVL